MLLYANPATGAAGLSLAIKVGFAELAFESYKTESFKRLPHRSAFVAQGGAIISISHILPPSHKNSLLMYYINYALFSPPPAFSFPSETHTLFHPL